MPEKEHTMILTAISKLSDKFDGLLKEVSESNAALTAVTERVIRLEKDNTVHWENYNHGLTNLENIRGEIKDNSNSLVQLVVYRDTDLKAFDGLRKDLNLGLKANKDKVEEIEDGIQASANQKKGVKLLFIGIGSTILVLCSMAGALYSFFQK